METIEIQTAMYLLREFLEEQKRLRDKGISLETISVQLGKMTERYRALEKTVYEGSLRQDRHAKRLKTLEERVLSRDERGPEEDTGVHRMLDARHAEEFIRMKVLVEEQQKEIERGKTEKANDDVWWKRQRWIWVAAGIMSIFLVLVTAVVTYAVSKLTGKLPP